MGDIRYVCISDMHLGEEDSILTNLKDDDVNPAEASPVMRCLVSCLRELIPKDMERKPTLILNGDILELALAKTNQSAMVFERFLELTMEKDNELFDDVIYYVPGNHDHHIWELARETQYVEYIKRHPEEHLLPPPWHKTTMIKGAEMGWRGAPIQSNFLNSLIQRHASSVLDELDIIHPGHRDLDRIRLGDDVKIHVAYPNLALLSGDRCVVFHHGHFLDSRYWFMSKLKAYIFGIDREFPETIEDLESENFAWIEFLWSGF